MKIVYELDNGSYVLEIKEKRLYALIEKLSDTPKYSSNGREYLTAGHFHEYRDTDIEFENAMYDLVRADLKDILAPRKRAKTEYSE